MIALHAVAALVGTVLVLAVLVSALETVVLPRNGFTRIARCVFAVADRILVHEWRNSDRRANLRALYAPIALVSLPLVWMIAMTVGFMFVFWGIKTGTMQRSFEVSGSSLFTLGFAEPAGTSRIWLTFIEATIGLGLVALLISYLPTIYSAHHEREKGIIVLRPFAGTPPSPIDLLVNLQRLGTLDDPELWRTVSAWLLELDQTHTAFPALCYFPESSTDQSWVASVGSMLDAGAILLSASHLSAAGDVGDAGDAGGVGAGDVGEGADTAAAAAAADAAAEAGLVKARGPMMAVAYGMPTLGRIGMSAGLPIEASPLLLSLMGRSGDAPPTVGVTRAEYLAALDRLTALVEVPEAQREECWRRFAWIRSGYDRALRGLSGLTMAAPAEWTTDRPARVGRPRLLLARPIRVDWDPDPTPHL